MGFPVFLLLFKKIVYADTPEELQQCYNDLLLDKTVPSTYVDYITGLYEIKEHWHIVIAKNEHSRKSDK